MERGESFSQGDSRKTGATKEDSGDNASGPN